VVAVSRKAKPGVREPHVPWPHVETYLLDVNVLIALLDPIHPRHMTAHAWFSVARASWASCNLTENGVVRIMSHPRYSNAAASAAVAAELLADLRSQPGHVFWPADFSLLDSPLVDRDRLLQSAQVTDTYLLALAVKNGGKLASFDRRLVTGAVHDGRAALHLIE
jgi:toxin-antitoxin system PIN domain toxin